MRFGSWGEIAGQNIDPPPPGPTGSALTGVKGSAAPEEAAGHISSGNNNAAASAPLLLILHPSAIAVPLLSGPLPHLAAGRHAPAIHNVAAAQDQDLVGEIDDRADMRRD